MKNYLFFIFILGSLLSCSNKSECDGENRIITVTIEPLRFFTERIVGDKFVVQSMVAAGGNPETYEPSTRQMINLTHSDLYIKVGSVGFERMWMRKLEANAPHTIVVDSSEGIIPAESTSGVVDPHTWMSVGNAIIIARNIYNAVINIDANDSIYYRENLEKLIDQIEIVDRQIRMEIVKDTSKSFLIYHPILTYFARDYGLRQISIEEEGREPSANQLAKVIDLAKAERVKTLFVQREFANRNTDVVMRSVGAQKEEIDPLGYEWCRQMVKIAQKLR